MNINHLLGSREQLVLDGLLSRFRFTPVAVRLSATMLEKSIIDARATIQAYLGRSGIAEYSAILQGPGSKVQIELPFISGGAAERRKLSFYRPRTKQGDPRFWVERLAATAKPGDALILAFSGTDLVVIHLVGTIDELARGLQGLLPSTFEERGELESVVRRLTARIGPLAKEWIPTGRAGPTGVGFTLEKLLGVAANSSKLPDFDGLELKSYRRGAVTGPGKLVSLFAKTPDWLGMAKGLGLLKEFGYQDDERGRLALYCTITVKPNSLGWQLRIDPGLGRVSVKHKGREVVGYRFSVLEKCVLSKHPATLFVRASSRRTEAGEEFRYEDVVLCREPSLANLLELIEDGMLGLDFTLHQKPDGRSRDHGYLWRIRESAIPRLYAYRRSLTATS